MILVGADDSVEETVLSNRFSAYILTLRMFDGACLLDITMGSGPFYAAPPYIWGWKVSALLYLVMTASWRRWRSTIILYVLISRWVSSGSSAPGGRCVLCLAWSMAAETMTSRRAADRTGPVVLFLILRLSSSHLGHYRGSSRSPLSFFSLWRPH
jgi:hypothetical protein